MSSPTVQHIVYTLCLCTFRIRRVHRATVSLRQIHASIKWRAQWYTLFDQRRVQCKLNRPIHTNDTRLYEFPKDGELKLKSQSSSLLSFQASVTRMTIEKKKNRKLRLRFVYKVK